VETHSASDRAIAEIPSCALDEAGRADQRARYSRLAPAVSRIEREADAVWIEFDEQLDRETLDETLAVERACCPFFEFAFDDSLRRLRATVREPEQAPALDAMADALRGVPRAEPQESSPAPDTSAGKDVGAPVPASRQT
jgi:hypothetical protein